MIINNLHASIVTHKCYKVVTLKRYNFDLYRVDNEISAKHVLRLRYAVLRLKAFTGVGFRQNRNVFTVTL